MFWFMLLLSSAALGIRTQKECDICSPIYSCDDPFFGGSCQPLSKLEGDPTTDITKTDRGCLFSVKCPPGSLPFYKETNGLWRSDFGTSHLVAVCIGGQWLKEDGQTPAAQLLCA